MATPRSIKSIEIQLGLNTTTLGKALSEVESSLKLTENTVKSLQQSLKLEYDPQKFIQAQEAAGKAVEETKKRVEVFQAALKALDEQGIDKLSEQYRTVQKELQYAENAAKKAENQLREINKIQFNEMNSQLETTKGKVDALREQLEAKYSHEAFKQLQHEAQSQLEQTQAKAEKLRQTLEEWKAQGVSETSKEFQELERQIVETDTEVIKIKDSLREINNIKFDQIEEAGKKLLPLSAAVTAGITASTKAAIDQESAFADVRKTIDATESEYAELKSTLRAMSEEIPVSTKELMGIAASAGQLGIEKENIISFTRTIADLGVATNLAGEEAASTLAKFANITQMPQENIGRLGSTIVALGNNTATTEKDIAAMSLRLAGAGNQANMTEADIVSLAAGLSSVGIEAEMGGSAFSKVLIEMQLAVETTSGRLEEFSQVAGMSSAEFARAFKEDATSALFAFVDGLATAEERGISAIQILDEMDISEVRLRDSLLRAAGASEMFNETLELGRQAWEDNIALTKEAEERYGTTESEIQKTKNALENAAASLGEIFLPMVKRGAEGIGDLAKWFNSLDDSTKQNIAGLALFVGALSPVLITVGKLGSSIGGVISTVGMFITEAQKAQSVMAGLNAVMAANPAALVTMALAALVTGIGIYIATTVDAESETERLNAALEDNRKKYDDLKASVKEMELSQMAEVDLVERLIPKYDELNQKVNKTTEEKEELRRIVERINNILPNAIDLINEETGAYKTQIGTLKELAEQKRAAIQADINYEAARGLMVQQGEAKANQAEAEANVKNLIQNYFEKWGDTLTPKQRKAMEVGQFDWEAYSQEKAVYGVDDFRDVRDIYEAQQTARELAVQASQYGAEADKLIDEAVKLGGKAVSTIQSIVETIDEAEEEKRKKATTRRATDEQINAYNQNQTTENAIEVISRGSSEYTTEEQKKQIKELYDFQTSEIKRLATEKKISAEEALAQQKALDEAYYANDRIKKNEIAVNHINQQKKIDDDKKKEADRQYNEELALIEKRGREEKLTNEQVQKLKLDAVKKFYGEEYPQAAIEAENKIYGNKKDKEKTPEDMYRDEKAMLDARLNAQKDSERDYEQHLENLKSLQSEYLTEGTKEWYQAQAEINRTEDEIKKQQTKSAGDKYERDKQLLKDMIDNEVLTHTEYYDKLVELDRNYAEYLNADGSEKTRRELEKEIAKEREAAKKEQYETDIADLRERYGNELTSYKEFADEYRAITERYYGDDEEARKAADEALYKFAQEKYGRESQLLGYAVEDNEKTLQEHYDELIRMREKYADYIEAEGNEAVKRALEKDIAAAGFGLDLAAIEEQYAQGEISLTEYLDSSLASLEEYYNKGSIEYEKHYIELQKIYERYADNELKAIQKNYDKNLINFDEYKTQYLQKVAELYGEESDIYKQAQKNITSEGQKSYRQREQELTDHLKLKDVTRKEFYRLMLEALDQYIDADTTAYRLYKQSILDDEKEYNEKILKERQSLIGNLNSMTGGSMGMSNVMGSKYTPNYAGTPAIGSMGGGSSGSDGEDVKNSYQLAYESYKETYDAMTDFINAQIEWARAAEEAGEITTAEYGRIAAQLMNKRQELEKEMAGLKTWEMKEAVMTGEGILSEKVNGAAMDELVSLVDQLTGERYDNYGDLTGEARREAEAAKKEVGAAAESARKAYAETQAEYLAEQLAKEIKESRDPALIIEEQHINADAVTKEQAEKIVNDAISKLFKQKLGV